MIEEERKKKLAKVERELVYEGKIRSDDPEYVVRPKNSKKRWWDRTFDKLKRRLEP